MIVSDAPNCGITYDRHLQSQQFYNTGHWLDNGQAYLRSVYTRDVLSSKTQERLLQIVLALAPWSCCIKYDCLY
jgi:hypothetical protein